MYINVEFLDLMKFSQISKVWITAWNICIKSQAILKCGFLTPRLSEVLPKYLWSLKNIIYDTAAYCQRDAMILNNSIMPVSFHKN